MLHDFVALEPNDTIVQNGANSAVGQMVIQMAREMRINVVNIVRKRDSVEKQEELNEFLGGLGAKYVSTEDELRKPEQTKKLWNEIKKPRLAFNCVGGKVAGPLAHQGLNSGDLRRHVRSAADAQYWRFDL